MSELELRVDWVEGGAVRPEEAATMCQLEILTDGEALTRGEDLRARSVRTWIRVSAYPLAVWFAANWWRLISETSRGDGASTDWRLSHELAGAGHGYTWPIVRFVSDGAAMHITTRESARSEYEGIRYFGRTSNFVPLASFERSISRFVDLVTQRLTQSGFSETPLHQLWRTVREERDDPHETFMRRIEARLGSDAGTASDDILGAFERLALQSGKSAAEEIAATFAIDPAVQPEAVASLAVSTGVKAVAPHPGARPQATPAGANPWEIGRSRAHWLRERLGLRAPVLDDHTLSHILGIDEPGVFDVSSQTSPLPIGLAVRDRHDNSLKLVFRARRRANRRFESARFLCDALWAPKEDLWLPATDAATARQKVQRAFAAEFLMPIDALRRSIGSDFTNEAFEGAAETYGVSALAVRSHLANNGLVDRF